MVYFGLLEKILLTIKFSKIFKIEEKNPKRIITFFSIFKYQIVYNTLFYLLSATPLKHIHIFSLERKCPPQTQERQQLHGKGEPYRSSGQRDPSVNLAILLLSNTDLDYLNIRRPSLTFANINYVLKIKQNNQLILSSPPPPLYSSWKFIFLVKWKQNSQEFLSGI